MPAEVSMSSDTEAATVVTDGDGARSSGIGFCLSGGGYRAALFHLGAVRRLNELGVLSKVATVSAVSGGSILAAHLAEVLRPWPEPGDVVADFDERVARPFRAFTTRNIRTAPFLGRLLPWHWGARRSAVDLLAAAYERHLTGLRLPELPDRPVFVFCSTDMSYGVNWVFSKGQIGDWQAGYLRPAPDWPLARAVAASSCFPPVFAPLRLGLDSRALVGGKARSGPARDRAVASIGLTDGGVYDNMGLEPVWRTHRTLLVSNGGATFDFGPDKGLLWRLQRYTSIVSRQASAVRQRWLIAGYQRDRLSGAYWSITNNSDDYRSVGYPPDLVREVIAQVRTDLDCFSEAEQAVLENHGYVVADCAVQRRAAGLISAGARPFVLPNLDWLDEARVRRAMAGSHRQQLPFGRR
jgi:NTE family protein